MSIIMMVIFITIIVGITIENIIKAWKK